LPRGKIIGGSSAVNACIALRGSPADYDAWPLGWSYDDLLPHFLACEADVDFGAESWHRADGVVPIRRCLGDDLTELGHAFLDTAIALGHKEVDDHNQPWEVGAGPAPMNQVDGVRQSTALTYLAPARARPNLVVRTDVLVDRVALAQGRATGVVLATGEHIDADTVILAAGAYGSPALLLRSGIGPAGELRAAGVAPVVDLPGVGRGLQDHPLLVLRLTGPPDLARPEFQALVTAHSSRAYPVGAPDLQFIAGGPPRGGAPVAASGGGTAFIVGTALLKPRSRGRVWLRSSDPADAPRIDLGLLSDPADAPVLREGVRELLRMVGAEPLASLVAVGPEVGEHDLDRWIAVNVGTYHHPVASCAMGDVVDGFGRVSDVDHLWVIDASIIPEVPSANTNLPVMALAERAARWVAGTR
jgi:choline dehydrogenase